MMKAKIAIVGPSKSGKTVLANFLSDTMLDPPKFGYRPTQGARVMEFKAQDSSVDGKRADSLQLELWDVGGDTSHEACWPAIVKGINGVVLVCDTDAENVNELDIWFKNFVKEAKLKVSQVVLFANKTSNMKVPHNTVILPPFISKVRLANTNTQEDPDGVREAFSTFLGNVRRALIARRDKEENNILTG